MRDHQTIPCDQCGSNLHWGEHSLLRRKVFIEILDEEFPFQNQSTSFYSSILLCNCCLQVYGTILDHVIDESDFTSEREQIRIWTEE